MQFWKKRSQEEIKETIFKALEKNVNYEEQNVLGIPASYLDDKVFSQSASFVKDAAFISTLVQNPNHIGCHTLGKSESFFAGTQAIEKELIEICAVDILKGKPGEQDGYVASGGTEANLQAIWIYRNYFMEEMQATKNEVCILCSADSHYSMNKAANILSLDIYKIGVDVNSRSFTTDDIQQAVQEAQLAGKKYFIVVVNMMTTMFGSIDDIDVLTNNLEAWGIVFKIHVDGAFGGFYYPFTDEGSRLNFENKNISSFTLDAHKMAQAPYGTGIFLVRKGFINYVNTRQASYVEGEDYTLIGSRSGANAVAVWMILTKYGPFGWFEKIFVLQKRTEWMCSRLTEKNILFYRHPKSNIISIRAAFLNPEAVKQFGLIPDNHAHPEWYKIVIMDHVTIEKLELLLFAMR